jgi:hypothetical protein
MKRLLIILIFLPVFGFGQVKVSEMTTATSVNDADYFLLVQSGSSKKVAFSTFDYGESDVAIQIGDSLTLYRVEVADQISDSIAAIPSGTIITLGTQGQIPYVNPAGTDFVYSSDIAWNGTNLNLNTGTRNIFIGESTGTSTTGIDNVFLGYRSGLNNIVGATNTFLGSYAGYTNNSGNGNVLTGYNAGRLNTTGSYNTFSGSNAGYSNTTGAENVFIGHYTGYTNSSGKNNVFLGSYAGIKNTTGQYNSIIGYEAGSENTTGSNNVFNGYRAGNENNGSFNVFTGYYSGYDNTTGNYNAFDGYYSGYGNTTGSNNVANGAYAGYANTTGGTNTFLGAYSGYSNVAGQGNVMLGYQAGQNETGSNKLYISNSATDTLIYGEFDNDILHLNADVTIDGDIFADNITTFSATQYEIPYVNSSGGGFDFSSSFTSNDTTVTINSAIGTGNIFVGTEAGSSALTGNFNTLLGYQSGKDLNGATNNTAYGFRSSYKITTGSNNVSIGDDAFRENLIGNNNVSVGSQSLYNATSNNNVAIGYQAGNFLTTGLGNIFIGYQAGIPETTGSNKLYIENSNSASPLIYGEFDNNLIKFNGRIEVDDGDANTFIGVNAGSNFLPSSDLNVLLGYNAGGSGLGGKANVLIGYEAGKLVAGRDNTFVGYKAGSATGGGVENTYIGKDAGLTSTGSSNIFIGNKAGSNETGSDRLYIENSNISTPLVYGEFDNDYLKVNGNLTAGVGIGNLHIGDSTNFSLTTGEYNTILGNGSGRNLISGSYNVLNGNLAGYNLTTGTENVFIGDQAGHDNTVGIRNIFIGNDAGFFETDSNKLYIENSSSTSPLIYGEFDNNIVRINGNFSADTVLGYLTEETLVGDEGINISTGELHVGRYDGGKESVFGEGDSHVVGMKVFSTTNGTTFTDNTAAASSATGSTYETFNGTTTVGSADYIGSDYPLCGIKLKTALVLTPGTGAVAREYWNGSTWQAFTMMATDADSPYTQRADDIGTVVGSEQVRFGSCDDQDTTTVNGVHGKYWIRFRITSAITSVGEIEQIKLHTNRYEINADGFTEYFGSGVYEKDIPLNLLPLSGATPSDEVISFASGLTLNYIDNGFNNSATDGFGGYVIIPEGFDTSKPLTFTSSYYVNGTATGDIEFQLETVQVSVGDTLDGTLPYKEQLSSIQTISVASDEILKTVSFSINVEDLIPGEGFAFKYYRDATVGNADDTLAGNIIILSNRLIGLFWKP